MRIEQLTESRNHYLYEGLDYSYRPTMRLWEQAGFQLKEAALTPDQIQNLFKEIETQATAAGGNRTALGMGKDALGAVNKAWEDLKTKVQDSGPIKAVDQKYDDVVAKIEKGLGGPDNAVNKVIQRYRKFAKDHPIAQGLIYSALIAAAGISGAGLGGAAVLGLLKMSDKLLQGEKFSSAAYSGAKTGAMAYGASKVGDYVKGKMADKDALDAMGDAQQLRRDLGGPDADAVTAPSGGGGIADRMNDNPMASPGLKKLAAKVASGEALTDQEMAMLDKFEASSVKMTDMVNAQGASGVGKAGAELTLNTGEKLAGDAAAQAANGHFDAIQDLKSKAVELAGNTKYGDAGNIASKAADVSDNSSAFLKQAQDQVKLNKLIQAKVDAGEIASKVADVATEAPKGAAMSADYLQKVIDGSVPRPMISADAAQQALDWQSSNPEATKALTKTASDAVSNTASNVASSVPYGGNMSTDYLQRVVDAGGKSGVRFKISPEDAAKALAWKASKAESRIIKGSSLSEGRVYLVFKKVCETNDTLIAEGILTEGPLDAIKGAAGKAAGYLQTKGKNLTTKVTADKLNSAWQKAGSPTDSEELKKFLGSQGVASDVVDQVYKTLKIQPAGAVPAQAAQSAVDIKQIKQMISALPTDRKVRLLKFLEKNPAKAAPAAKPAKGPNRDAGNGRIEPTMA